MRIISDVVENVFGSIRLLFLLGFGAVVLFGLFMTVGAAVIAPQAVDAAAERAERVGNRAIEAAQEEHRNAQLAEEGWGYEDTTSSRDRGSYQDGEYVGGWGSED